MEADLAKLKVEQLKEKARLKAKIAAQKDPTRCTINNQRSRTGSRYEEKREKRKKRWNAETDMFTFKLNPPRNIEYTKRGLLNKLATLFDPLQLLAPFTIRAMMGLAGNVASQIRLGPGVSCSVDVKSGSVNYRNSLRCPGAKMLS